MNASRFLRALALVVPCAALSAQTAPFDASEDTTQGSEYFRVQGELANWRMLHGESWRVVYDSEVAQGRFLYGGLGAAGFAPRSNADYMALARAAVQDSQPIHGIDSQTLVEDRVVFLPLQLAGTSDKVSVRFRQAVGGVAVLGGWVNVLFDTQGRLLSVDTTGLPGLAGFATQPGIDATGALDSALSLFAGETGLPPTSAGTPELAIDQHLAGKQRLPRLVWQVEVHFSGADTEPVGYAYRIDALRGGLVSRRDLVHHFDVSGTVRSLATAGLAPDSATNPEQQLVMPHLRVTSAQGNAVTNPAGNFTIVGASAPLSVTVTYNGTFCQTDNQAQADYTLTTTLNSSSGNVIVMNPASQDLVTAEANGLNWIGLLRDWTRAVNPSDATADFLATSNVNINSTCNAYYNGSSVNFYRAGGGCVNTAYSTVVIHEMGHWLNDLYGSGNGPDGFGEGNADNFSTHATDDPIVGLNFCGNGCHVRDGNNNRQFCGDCCGGCYGEVHADGEVLMGALWKVRQRLKTSLGQAAGRAASDTLFNGWMNAYNDSQIKTILEIHYLTLDDDDGNINNGTPHYTEIDGGFKQQGFPGFGLSFVSFANVTQLGNTTNESGPYAISADITTTFTPPVTNPTLFYRVDGGSWNSTPLALSSGSTYAGSIPGQVSPAKVEYYLSAQDGAAQGGTFPAAGATGPLKFYVGIVKIWFATNFETGVQGWTHAQVATQDDWHLSSQLGVDTSFGKSGDPTSATSGQNIWGNDLGPSGWNGAYSNNVSNYLRSPPIDLSQATGSTLVLKRWLTVEKSQFDKATIKVDGQQVWINPAGVDLLDTTWNDLEIDVSAIADGKPAVPVEFGLSTDAGVTFGGWNIDDFAILSVEPVCPQPATYCTAKITSAFTLPTIAFTGSASLSAANLVVTLSGAIPSTNGTVFWGAQQASTPLFGGTLCIAPPITRGPLTLTTAGGAASFGVTILPSMVGTTRQFQWWFRDPADPFTVGLSDALSVTFCN